MSAQVSRAAIIWAIVRKDAREFGRERFFVVISAISILIYGIGFWLMPSSVDESFTVGIHQTGMDAIFAEVMGDQGAGIEIVQFQSVEALEAALGVGDAEPEDPLAIGLAFPDDFLQRVAAGQQTTVRVYVDANVPVELRSAMESFVREIAYALSGNPLPVADPDREVIVLGEDRMGDQVPFREKIRPLFAVLALVIETFALSSLVATEIQARTVTAVLVSPTRVSDFLAAKGILGTGMAFAQALLLLLIIGSLASQPLILLCAILLGAVLVTGFGLIAGSAGKDFIETLFYGMAFMIPLMIPAIAVLFPGTAAVWVKVLPSYGLVQTVVQASAYGAGWLEVMPHLATLLAWCLAAFAVGWIVLKRKVETL
jgi:ABC-2 type transport system permease protein